MKSGMPQGGKKTFLNKQKLYNMIQLRRSGLSYYSLGLFFNCSRKAVEAQCKKYGVEIYLHPIRIERIVLHIVNPNNGKKQKQSFRIEAGEKINIGKSYKEYLKEDKKILR